MSSVNLHSVEDTTTDTEPNRNLPNEGHHTHHKRKPLPWSQLSIAYLIETTDTLIISVRRPFINQFVQDTGITQGDERRIGYFTGILLSAFSIAEATSVIPWGVASDRFGRRSILVLGPLGLAFTILAFGMATQYWVLVIFQFLTGVFAGNITSSKTVIGEITDPSNIADAYALLPVAWTVGSTIGPFIGGLLARPASRWPDTFGKIEYLRNHPYFLPCFVASLVAILAFAVAVVALKETLPSAISQRNYDIIPDIPITSPTLSYYDEMSSYNSTGSDQRDLSMERRRMLIGNEELKPQSLQTLLKLRDIQIILTNLGFLGFCATGAQALDALMWSTSIELGGLGWSSYTIGMTLTVCGIVTIVLQVAGLAKLIQHFGARKVQIACSLGLGVSFLAFPVASFFAQQSSGSDWRVWAIIVVSLATQSMRSGSYASLQIILTGATPTQSSLGTTIGLGEAVSATMRCLGPFVATSLHSLSLQYQLAGGNAVYYIMAGIAIYGVTFSLLLPQD